MSINKYMIDKAIDDTNSLITFVLSITDELNDKLLFEREYSHQMVYYNDLNYLLEYIKAIRDMFNGGNV